MKQSTIFNEAPVVIEQLGLSTRTLNMLKRANINTTKELYNKRPNELLKYKNFGRKALEEVVNAGKPYGFKFLDRCPSSPSDDELFLKAMQALGEKQKLKKQVITDFKTISQFIGKLS